MTGENLSLILFTLALSVLYPICKSQCTGNQLAFGQNCYTFPSMSANFVEADTYCRNNGNGHLCSVWNAFENNFIQNNARDDIWIGLYKSDGRWTWTDETIVTYTNWQQSYPSDSDHSNCVIMGKSSNGLWRNLGCDSRHSFCCKYSQNSTLTTSATTELPKTDCSEYDDVRGLRNISIPGGDVVEVYCDEGYTIIQSRGPDINPEEDFNRNLSEYQRGFGQPGLYTNFWLGLDNLHLLTTSRNYALNVEWCCNEGDYDSECYNNFHVSNVSTEYQLFVTSEIPQSLNQPFGPNADVGAKFSTITKYNGIFPEQFCFSRLDGGGGWWFGSCLNNPNGHYYSAGDANYEAASCSVTNFTPPNPPVNGSGFGIQYAAMFEGIGPSFKYFRMTITPDGACDSLALRSSSFCPASPR